MEGPASGAFFLCDMSAIQEIFKGFAREAGASSPRRPKSPLGDDSPVHTRLIGVRTQGFVGFEVHVAFNGKPERAAKIAELVHPHESKLLGPPMALALRARLRRFKTALPF